MEEKSNQQERIKKLQQAALEKLLSDVEEKYLTREHIKVRFLSGRNSAGVGGVDVVTLLDMLDAVRENLKTSLQFGDFRRAIKYLALLNLLCEETAA